MIRYAYSRAESVAEAASLAAEPGAIVIAGGTNLVDLLKYNVERPARLVDIGRLPLGEIREAESGGLRVGALVTNADLAYHPEVERRYPILSSALLAGATGQLRNAATMGGNLNQRTRCYYFYDTACGCNKREPGSGCPAIEGENRILAILGTSGHCIATHPSDMCVALAALDAVVHVQGPNGERAIPIADYHRLPGDEPERDNTLRSGEIVTAVELPAQGFADHHTYLKLRDRLSYAFALVSAAVGLRLEGGVIREARLALGGVAHKPWRDRDAEAMLIGERPGRELFRSVADHILRDARGYGGNSFKIDLARRVIPRALEQAAAGTPQSQTEKRIA